MNTTPIIINFDRTVLNRGLFTPEYVDAFVAEVKVDEIELFISKYDDEDYWIIDAVFRDGFPILSNGTGSRVTRLRAVNEEIAALLNKNALEFAIK